VVGELSHLVRLKPPKWQLPAAPSPGSIPAIPGQAALRGQPPNSWITSGGAEDANHALKPIGAEREIDERGALGNTRNPLVSRVACPVFVTGVKYGTGLSN